MEKVLIVVTVPPEHTETLLNAIAEAGGGQIGEYTHCAYMSLGYGRFKPSLNAKPHSGENGEISKTEEMRIETFCQREDARTIVSAIRSVHPYEEPVIYIIPLLTEADL
ncbi:hypothetical protein MASR2M15_15280 [Anaerolineales bacterium]